MNTIRKSLTVLACAALLTGCASNTPTSTAASSSNSSDTLRVGMECNYAPFNWSTTKEGEYTQPISSADYCDGYDVVVAKNLAYGYDVMMAKHIAEELGMELEIVKLDWDNLILSLNNNQIDAVIAGMTATDERKQQVNFTDPYYVSEEVLIVKKDSQYTSATSLEDFKGATVQGQMNTIYDEVIDQISGVNHMPAAETFPAAIQALQAGSVDAVTSELPVANGVISANPDLAVVRFAEGKGFKADTSVSIAVRKNDDELLNALQDALKTIDTDTRNTWMEEAVNRQPASEE